LSGESPLDQELAMRLLRRVAEESAPHKESAPEPVEGRRERPEIPTSLAPRELEVLRHLSVGRTNGQIAKELHLSLSTVKRYLERIISKLGVSDRTQAAVKAVEMGLLPEQQE
jgi:DNA-binding NarL/FixJ family response regulator